MIDATRILDMLVGGNGSQGGAPAPYGQPQAPHGHGRPGQGEYWFRLFARPNTCFWDTTEVRDGRYRLDVTAWDLTGNFDRQSVEVTVTNA